MESTLSAINWPCNRYRKPNVSKQNHQFQVQFPFMGAVGAVCKVVFATKSNLGLATAIRFFRPKYVLRQRD